MLQAQAQAQAQIQASIRAQLQQHALRQQQQQQQQQQVGLAIGTAVSSSATLPNNVLISKPAQTLIVSTISSTNNVAPPVAMTTAPTAHHEVPVINGKNVVSSSQKSSNQSGLNRSKHEPSSSKNHQHTVIPKNKTSSISKPVKSSSFASHTERKSKHKNGGK